MSYTYLLFFLIFSISFIWDFEKTIMIYTPLKLIFHSGIYLIDASFSLNLDLAISFVAIVVYCFYASKYRAYKMPQWMLCSGVIYCIGLFIYGGYPRFAPHTFFYEPITAILYIFVLFKVINRKTQLKQLLSGFVVVSLILVLDGIIDVIFGVNIITSLESILGGERFDLSDNVISRAEVPRTTSFMLHSISMGTLSVFLWEVFILLSLEYSTFIKNDWKFKLAILTLPVCMVFSNSRTTILTLLCSLPIFLRQNKLSKDITIFVLVSVVAIGLLYQDYFLWLYKSLFYESQMDIGGSTTELRERQLEIALYYFFEKPVFGQGIDFDLLKFEEQRDVMGMESVWFGLMFKRGFVGLCTYVLPIFISSFYLIKYNKILGVFVLSWLTSITFSTQMGLSIFFYFFTVFTFYKIIEIKKHNNGLVYHYTSIQC